MALQIRLLGPVEVRVDDQLVAPGAAKRRAVLAGLAIESNRSVSLDRLADMVWSEVPPASAVANLRSHAAALRRTLGARLVARPNAYELRLAPCELDVTEFHQLAGEGRAALAADNPVAAVSRLDAALALWRGPAGDGLPRGTALDNRWASLDEQRLQVFEEVMEARLTLGEHGDLLPGLRRLLAAHPLRERAWAQLMLALYRCGDVPAALTAYRGARATLQEQLGIEPGEELQRLHRAMLDRAPELSYAPPLTSQPTARTVEFESGPHIAGPVPRELPPDLMTFVGRTREIADMLAAVTGATPAVVVTGAAGSGKTALVIRAAHAMAADFPDGQIFVDLGYQPSFTGDEVLARVLRTLGVDDSEIPDRVSERSGRLRSLLAGRRFLMVVDGVTHAAQVRPVVPAGPGTALIVVAQRHLRSLDGVSRVVLDGLPAAEGRAMLDALAGAERLDAAPAAAAELVRLCAGSPLALRIAASRLVGRPSASVAAMVAELRDAGHRLSWLADDDLSVRQRLDVTYAAVCADDDLAERIFMLLGAVPEDATLPDDIAAQLGVSNQRMWQALEKLLDAHLVRADDSAGYYLPPLVRDYAAEIGELPTPPHLHPLPGWCVDPVTVPPVPTQRRPTWAPRASHSRRSAAESRTSRRSGDSATLIPLGPELSRLPDVDLRRWNRDITPPRVRVLAGMVMLLAGACGTDDDGATSASRAGAPPSASAAATGPAMTPPETMATPGTAATDVPRPEGDWRVAYGRPVSSGPGRVAPTGVPALAPAVPLPILVQIEASEHPAEGLSRITFVFRGSTPSYEVGYVDRVESDGTGAPVARADNAFLSVRFHPTQGA